MLSRLSTLTWQGSCLVKKCSRVSQPPPTRTIMCRPFNSLMKTFRPAMWYRPSPTFRTFSLEHLLDGHWQSLWTASAALRTFRSSSVIGPECSGGSAGVGEGEIEGEGTSSGSSALPRDQSSSVVSLGTPSLPVGPLSLTDLLISDEGGPDVGSSHLAAVAATSEVELLCLMFSTGGLGEVAGEGD